LRDEEPLKLRKNRLVQEKMKQLPEDFREKLRRYFIEKGINPHTKYVYIQVTIRWAKTNGKDPLQASRDDVSQFFEKMLEEGLKRRTASMYLNRFKAFVRWLNGGELPEAWKSFKVNERPEGDLRDKILQPEDIKKLLKGSKSVKTKAVISLLYESAMRIGELTSLRIKDIEFTDYGLRVRIKGKTGERVIPIHDSVPYLRAWLQLHPSPKPEAYLFPGRDGGRSPTKSLAELVKVAGERVGLEGIHPHMLRHTRLTELAKKLTEQELKLFAGWTKGSKMASVYVHLSGRDVENAVLGKVFGMKEIKEEEEKRALEPKVCPDCGYMNPADSSFCLKCGYPLTEEAREKIRPIEETIDELMERVLKSKKARSLLRKALEMVLEEGEKVE